VTKKEPLIGRGGEQAGGVRPSSLQSAIKKADVQKGKDEANEAKHRLNRSYQTQTDVWEPEEIAKESHLDAKQYLIGTAGKG